MKKEINNIQNKIRIAEKIIKDLHSSSELKKLGEFEANQIAKFYLEKSNNRIETAKIIERVSKNKENTSKTYSDYSECVSAAYYSMYYIVHSYLAKAYKTKLNEGLRGVHSITNNLVLYYLVKTEKLAKYLYEEYQKTLGTVAQIQNLTLEDFQINAYEFVGRYDKNRAARETFTYKTTKNAEEQHAKQTIKTAEEFINVIKQLMQV